MCSSSTSDGKDGDGNSSLKEPPWESCAGQRSASCNTLPASRNTMPSAQGTLLGLLIPLVCSLMLFFFPDLYYGIGNAAWVALCVHQELLCIANANYISIFIQEQKGKIIE